MFLICRYIMLAGRGLHQQIKKEQNRQTFVLLAVEFCFYTVFFFSTFDLFSPTLILVKRIFRLLNHRVPKVVNNTISKCECFEVSDGHSGFYGDFCVAFCESVIAKNNWELACEWKKKRKTNDGQYMMPLMGMKDHVCVINQ